MQTKYVVQKIMLGILLLGVFPLISAFTPLSQQSPPSHIILQGRGALNNVAAATLDRCDVYIYAGKVNSSTLWAYTVTTCQEVVELVGSSIKAQHCPLSIGSTCILPWEDEEWIPIMPDLCY